MVSGPAFADSRQAGLQSLWEDDPVGCARHGEGKGFAPRGARRGVGMPSMNVAAQTNPKAKMTPKMRYVHSNRISDTFSGARDENLAEKVDGPARACWNAASRLPGRRARQRAAPSSSLWRLVDLRQDLLQIHLSLDDPIETRACSSIGRTRRCPRRRPPRPRPMSPVHPEPHPARA